MAELSEAQRHVLGRLVGGLSIDGDLYKGKGSQARTAGRWRTADVLLRRGLVIYDTFQDAWRITRAGRRAISENDHGHG
jgi:hypothetical protein